MVDVDCSRPRRDPPAWSGHPKENLADPPTIPVPLLALVLLVLAPLGTSSAWEALSFRGIPANGVTFGQDGLSIRVQRSAGPLVWPLPSPSRVGRLRVSGAVTGQLNTTPDRQGSERR